MGENLGHIALSFDENNSGTLGLVSREYKDESHNYNLCEHERPRCAYVVMAGSRAGLPQFCVNRAAPGSPYCVEHRALCRVAPGTAQAARIAAAQDQDAAAPPPPEFAHLAACDLLEPADPGEDAEALAALGRARVPQDEA